MNKSYHALATLTLDAPCSPTQPLELPPIIHVDDPADHSFVDFERHRPPLISTYRSLDDARAEMELFNLPVLLVTDIDKNVIGIITSEDILGEKPVKLSQEKRIPRSEIEVEMIMTPLREVPTLDLHDLTHAKIGHIIQTLREVNQHTLLVKQDDKLKGYFSASIISNQLDTVIADVLSNALSIAQLQHDLHT
ncbi:MAG: CBS domain-containing protein [Gammaproteobacteria bacterium]|nr:CBS domain-containing protein [Gammaproteobacteria bacterium]